MPIDYSKWDKLDVSSSEDEDDNHATPRVTRLDAPGKVTFGGKDGSVSLAPPSVASTQAPQPPAKSTPAFWTDKGGILQATSSNGVERNLYWTQDRYSVTLRLELTAGEKVKSVVVDGILSYSDRWSAVGSTKPTMVCSSDVVLLTGELPHAVHLAEEDSDEGTVDWSIEETNRIRSLTITLHKAVPMQGLSVWWRRPLMEFPEADLAQVRGSNEKGTASKEFLEAWEEAHKIFRQGKDKRTKKPLT